jgi:glycosyltransferase involved in cell wall biosynthesis
MTLVFLSARYPPDFIGGGELSTATIAEGLASLGHRVTVLTGAQKTRTEQVNGVTVRRSKDLYRLWAKPLFELRASAAMLPALQALLPPSAEILHAHDFRSALLLSLLDGPARVVTVRDFASICGTTNNMWWDGRSCDGCFWPNVLFRCHRVVEASPARKPFRVWQYKYNLAFRGRAFQAIPHHIYISAALRDRVATRSPIPPSSLVIPNPLGQEWLAPPPRQPSPPRAVYAGTVESHKGIAVLLEAYRHIVNDMADVSLDIIGAGDLRGYQTMARAYGIESSVRFLGKLPPEQVREQFDTARVIVQPSLWEEPFGRTVLEAYARSRPVVASDIGGLRDLVTQETGILVPPGNALALAQALRRFLQSEPSAAACGAAGRLRVEREFTVTRIAERYESFYRESVVRR